MGIREGSCRLTVFVTGYRFPVSCRQVILQKTDKKYTKTRNWKLELIYKNKIWA